MDGKRQAVMAGQPGRVGEVGGDRELDAARRVVPGPGDRRGGDQT
jgi:hypothetical protein